MYETDSKDLWRIFRSHHYLSGDFNKAAKLYLVYWDDVLVAMASVLTMPCGTIKYAYRQHRLVVLPDFQGLGIGTKINDFLAQYYIDKGYKYFIRTTHVRLKNHLSKLPEWKSTSTNGKLRGSKAIEDNIQKQQQGLAHTGITGDRRIAASFEYLGCDYVNKPEKIIRVDEVKNLDKLKEYISKLKSDYYVKVVTGKPGEDSDIEKAVRDIGVRTEQLWIKSKEKLSLNSKYKNTEIYIEGDETMKISEYFKEELDYIKNDTLKKIVAETLDESPECIVHIPASSSGRYHPSYSLGEGGLMRHIKAAIGIANCMIENDIFTNMVMSKEDREAEDFVEKRQIYSDIAYASLILHDCKKPDDTEKHSTRFDHPLLAAKLFKEVAKKHITKDNMGYMQFAITGVYRCISSHMGQYNTAPYAKGIVLPKPNSGIEHFVHMCDYLGSRKFLIFDFDIYNN